MNECGELVKKEINQKEDKTNLGSLNLEMIKRLMDPQKSVESNQPDDCLGSAEMETASMQHHHINEFRLSDVLETKTIKPIDFNFLKLTIDQVKSLPTDELLKLLSGESHKGAIHESTIQLISNEILSRQIKEYSKPHWTITPTFIFVCLSTLLTAVSIVLTIYFSVFYKAENNNKHADQSYTAEKNSSPK